MSFNTNDIIKNGAENILSKEEINKLFEYRATKSEEMILINNKRISYSNNDKRPSQSNQNLK